MTRAAPPLRKGGAGGGMLHTRCSQLDRSRLSITFSPLDHIAPGRNPEISHDSSLLITCLPLDHLLTAPVDPPSSFKPHSVLRISPFMITYAKTAGIVRR